MTSCAAPSVSRFPLRGEWVAVTSPGDRIPSHGTDVLAQRYAYERRMEVVPRRRDRIRWLG